MQFRETRKLFPGFKESRPLDCGKKSYILGLIFRKNWKIRMEKEMNSPAIPEKPRRVRVKYSTNPFLQNVVAKLGDKRVAVSFKPGLAEIDQQTGEITPLQGQITKMISADREGFVKLYTAQIDAFSSWESLGERSSNT